jgi:hypothetical protein
LARRWRRSSLQVVIALTAAPIARPGGSDDPHLSRQAARIRVVPAVMDDGTV